MLHRILPGVPSALWPIGLAVGIAWSSALGQEPAPLTVRTFETTNSQPTLSWVPYPATVQYRVLSSDTVDGPFDEDPGVGFNGFTWTGQTPAQNRFYRVESVPLAPDVLLATTALNRLAYGPSPDELDRIHLIGAEAWIEEQLSPENIVEDLEIDRVQPVGGWHYATVTGEATSSLLYVYLTSAGEIYVDDLVLVAGSTAESGPNLLRNADFESPLDWADWHRGTNFTETAIATDTAHGGSASLRLVATRAGSGGTGTSTNAVAQSILPSLLIGQTYTLSFWYLAPTNAPSNLIIRLSNASNSGNPIQAQPDAGISLRTRLEGDWATLADLRSWHLQHAVQSRRQLVEVLDQFLENHFVTQHSKSRDYLGRYYSSSVQRDQLATRMEWVEHRRWREALLNPQCTFHDLLRISAESPAMIIYLDTVTSRGDGTRVANENYARELLELFTCGVDNGYDQDDIVQLSRVWTGWRIRLVDADQEFNPFAPQSTTILPGSTNASLTTVSNLAGVWALSYQSNFHNPSNKLLFAGKTVPARFGPPYTTRTYGNPSAPGLYELAVLGRTGTNGIAEGHDAIAYLANLPFTQEYLSVKLCRWFVHDEFIHGHYDYTAADLSPEGRLVRDCMAAWDHANPQGQIRPVLDVIFRSDLLRSHGASMQKVKTPLEFCLSAVRALRAQLPNGSVTATLDGTGLPSALSRMGGMSLFDRDDPDGYPETAPGWISAGTLAERLRFVQAYCIAPGQSGRNDANGSVCDPVALLQQRLPADRWNDAGTVADLFLELLFPAEGSANLGLHRTAALTFLNTSDTGSAASPFTTLSPTTTAYDTRVRGMVAMLLSTARFQEQ